MRRFAAPEPARRIALVRRAGTGPAQWFDDLAEVLRAAGEAAIGTARDPGTAGRQSPEHS